MQPSPCPLSNASGQPQPQALSLAPVQLIRSALPALPNAINVDPLEDMLDAFDNCISHMLLMANTVQTFIRMLLYRKMISDLSRQELASSPISPLDDLVRSCNLCFARVVFAMTPHENI